MVSAKILLVFVLAIVVAVVYLIFVYGGKFKYDAITQEGIESIKTIGICGISQIPLPLVEQCTSRQTDRLGTNCLFDKSGNRNFKCVLCERDVGGSSIYSCQAAACGCPFGWKSPSGSISVSLDPTSYKPLEKMTIRGKLTLPIVADASGLKIPLSFFDENSNQLTESLGEIGVAETKNSEGEFEYTYTLPQYAKAGKYFLLAEYKQARDLREFSVT